LKQSNNHYKTAAAVNSLVPSRWLDRKCSITRSLHHKGWGGGSSSSRSVLLLSRIRHIQDGSHIDDKGIDVCIWTSICHKVHMDESLPGYRCSRWPSFWKLTGIMATSRETNRSIMLWLRL
jgi:hypothetical protein